MQADWYEDPLGRYDGRFFDGEKWTAEVSSEGVLQVDPDFSVSFERSGEAAVAPVDQGSPRRASTRAESPVRIVAVLDESVMAHRSSNAGSSPRASARARRWFALAALAAVAALLVFFLTRGDSTADLDASDQDRVEDLEAGGLLPEQDAAATELLDPEVATGPLSAGVVFGPGDAVQVGSVRIANGAPMLADLARWHARYAADNDVTLDDGDAGCWFGQLADAAVQVVACGPVAGSSISDYAFDLIPIAFETDAEGRQVAVANVEGATPNTLLANALVLVAHPDGVQPPAGTS